MPDVHLSFYIARRRGHLTFARSALSQNFRHRVARFRFDEQFGDISIECNRHSLKQANSRVLLATLQRTHIGAANAGVSGEGLLRHRLCDSKSTNVTRDSPLGVHAQRPTGCSLLNHSI